VIKNSGHHMGHTHSNASSRNHGNTPLGTHTTTGTGIGSGGVATNINGVQSGVPPSPAYSHAHPSAGLYAATA
jgi:hypothetical protein